MKKGCAAGILVFLVIAASLGIIYLFISVIPSQVNSSFGSPNPALSPVQRIRYAFELFVNKDELYSPSDPFQTQFVDFDVDNGEAVSSISARLEETGLIPDATLFNHLLIYTGLDVSILSGRFKLSSSKSPVEIALILADPLEVRIPFSVLPGWRLEEIADSIQSYQFELSRDDFLNAAREPSSVNITPPIEGGMSLEGMIRPGITYVKKNVGLTEFIAALLINKEDQLNGGMQESFRAKRLNNYQVIILASIVEREAVKPNEMKLISSVFLNRLQQGMLLQSDPTVQYAIGFDEQTSSWWKNPLTYDDLKINSPYNTYLFGGLPPSPISNPSREALEAVAFPERTEYLFFQAKCDGSGFHNFAETYDEHLANSCN
jgi:UPF0755 protein